MKRFLVKFDFTERVPADAHPARTSVFVWVCAATPGEADAKARLEMIRQVGSGVISKTGGEQ